MSAHIRRYENVHIPLWLVKDICWMLQWKTLGVAMIIPTLSVAVFISYVTRKTDEFFVNLAICFWIIANAYWMCCEFFGYEEYKDYAGFSFLLGFISVSWFYLQRFRRKKDILRGEN